MQRSAGAAASSTYRQTSISWRVNYKSLDFKSVLVSIPFLAVVAMLLRRSRRREKWGAIPNPQWRERLSIPLATAPVARSAY